MTLQLQQELDQLQYHRAGPPAGADAYRTSAPSTASRTTPYQTSASADRRQYERAGGALALTPTSPAAVAAHAGVSPGASGVLGIDQSTLSLLEEERRERAQLERTISSAFGSMVEGVRQA